MELILILAVGVIVASTSIISPGPKDINKVENTPKIEVSTPVIKETKPEAPPVIRATLFFTRSININLSLKKSKC